MSEEERGNDYTDEDREIAAGVFNLIARGGSRWSVEQALDVLTLSLATVLSLVKRDNPDYCPEKTLRGVIGRTKERMRYTENQPDDELPRRNVLDA